MYITKVQISKYGLHNRRYIKAILSVILYEEKVGKKKKREYFIHTSIHLSEEDAYIYKREYFSKESDHKKEVGYKFLKAHIELSLHQQLKNASPGIFYSGNTTILKKIREKKLGAMADLIAA